jgi:acetyl esterase/lipase
MTGALLTLSLALAVPGADRLPETIPLWPRDVPGARGNGPADRPTLTIFLPPPDRATGTAVVVCPGGGYGGLAASYEGNEPAEWLTRFGVAGFVLRYRVAPYRHPVPLEDAQRALRTVRARAAEWHLKPDRIGIWGFSAGGHLASSAATQFGDGNPSADDPVERAGCRPDFAILSYPVITLVGPFAHTGSRDNLLGRNAAPDLAESLSTDRRVTARTPPTFLFHTNADKGVVPENSILFYLALRKAGVPAELHVYEKGNHGVGLALKDPVLSTWTERLHDWLDGRGLLKRE